jgi:AraC-like DNA-binding protein
MDQLAEAARLSPRQFSRVFRVETGLSPAKAMENLRFEAARLMLEQGRLPVEEIANTTGFGDRERIRRSFLRSYGQTPGPLETRRILLPPSEAGRDQRVQSALRIDRIVSCRASISELARICRNGSWCGVSYANRIVCSVSTSRRNGSLALARNSTVANTREVSPTFSRSWIMNSPAP